MTATAFRVSFCFLKPPVSDLLTDNKKEFGLNGVVTLSHFWVVQETGISQRDVVDVFSKLAFHEKKTFKKTCGKSLQLQYANETEF